jgi:META domain-containing protein
MTRSLWFAPDGTASVRFDCNRGRGTWTSPGPNQLQFGPLALTRMACPPAAIYDRIVQQWPFVRSYVIERGHLPHRDAVGEPAERRRRIIRAHASL